MHLSSEHAERRTGAGRRAAARLLVAVVALAAWLGMSADDAAARYSARVSGGTLTLTGNGKSDTLALRLRLGVPTVLEADVGNNGSADISVDRSRFVRIVVNAGAGGDVVLIDQANGSFTNEETTTLNGGDGNDRLFGGSGAERFLGGAGADRVDGNQANDAASLGGGRDVFVWDPGDGSDVVRGQKQSDLLAFNGSGAGEIVDLAANGPRLRLLRNVGNIVMDVTGTERVLLHALGGADAVTVRNLAPTEVASVSVDLESTLGGGAGDGQPDTVTVIGRAGPDSATVTPAGAALAAARMGVAVSVFRAEPANDRLVLPGPASDVVDVRGSAGANAIGVQPSPTPGNVRILSGLFPAPVDVNGGATLRLSGLGGADVLSATGNLAAIPVPVVFDGGPGNDQLLGGNGADRLLGGTGNDLVDGNQANDTALMGDGNDNFRWDPGDGNDAVRGEKHTDVLEFNGSGAGEIVALSANGPRLHFTRNVGNIVLDLDGVERVFHRALGGADTVTVGDLGPTDVTRVTTELASTLGGTSGDVQPDAVVVNGSSVRDTIRVEAPGGLVVTSGLAAVVRIAHPEVALDTLTVNGLGGSDTITAAPDVSSFIGLTLNQ